MPLLSFAQQDSIVGRPYKLFDTTAFCSYSSFHPSHYLTDNNWDILCAFVVPGTTAKLDSLGIPYSKSQLRDYWRSAICCPPTMVSTQPQCLYLTRQRPRLSAGSQEEFADSIFPVIEPRIKELISDYKKAGYSEQTYSLVFSYLLDTYIWDDERVGFADKLRRSWDMVGCILGYVREPQS